MDDCTTYGGTPIGTAKGVISLCSNAPTLDGDLQLSLKGEGLVFSVKNNLKETNRTTNLMFSFSILHIRHSVSTFTSFTILNFTIFFMLEYHACLNLGIEGENDKLIFMLKS